MACRKCGGGNGWTYVDSICNKCAKKEYLRIVLPIAMLLFLLITIIGGMLGDMQYKYQYDKCTNLKKPTYEFTHDVQLNVEYTERCYYITNHPLAYFEKVSGGLIIGIMLLLFSPMYIVFRKF